MGLAGAEEKEEGGWVEWVLWKYKGVKHVRRAVRAYSDAAGVFDAVVESVNGYKADRVPDCVVRRCGKDSVDAAVSLEMTKLGINAYDADR